MILNELRPCNTNGIIFTDHHKSLGGTTADIADILDFCVTENYVPLGYGKT